MDWICTSQTPCSSKAGSFLYSGLRLNVASSEKSFLTPQINGAAQGLPNMSLGSTCHLLRVYPDSLCSYSSCLPTKIQAP